MSEKCTHQCAAHDAQTKNRSCDHQCAYHRFKWRSIGEGDVCLLITRDVARMVETSYIMTAAESSVWCEALRDVDMEKFEQLLVEGKTLEQAYEMMRDSDCENEG